MADPEDNVEDDEVEASVEDDSASGDAVEEVESEETTEEDSGEETEGEEPSAAAPAATTRGETRIAKLARERNELRERLAAAEALASERGRVASQPAKGDTESEKRLRDEKLSLMEPHERTAFLQNEKLQQMEQTVLLTQLQTQDTLDRSSYQLTARSNPIYAKHSQEVERRLSAERQAGRNWSRETILAQILGEAALKAKPDKKQKDEARERVSSSKGTPVKGRSNVSTGYRPGRAGESLEDLERRLENVTF